MSCELHGFDIVTGVVIPKSNRCVLIGLNAPCNMEHPDSETCAIYGDMRMQEWWEAEGAAEEQQIMEQRIEEYDRRGEA